VYKQSHQTASVKSKRQNTHYDAADTIRDQQCFIYTLTGKLLARPTAMMNAQWHSSCDLC